MNDVLRQEKRPNPEELLLQAEFQRCLDELEGDFSPTAVLIRMRALLSLGRHHEITRAGQLEIVESLPAVERGRAMALMSAAYFQSGMREAAESAVDVAYELVGNDKLALPEVRYHHALQRWGYHDVNGAEEILKRVCAEPKWRAKALVLRAWCLCRRGDYSGQLRELNAAYEAAQVGDVWSKARILRSAAALALDLCEDEFMAEFIATRADDLTWTAGTRRLEFFTHRSLAWCEALAGRPLAAFDRLARSHACVSSNAQAVLLYTDRAAIARYAGEGKTDTRSLHAAQHCADQIDWTSTDEERTALLHLAELTAPIDPKMSWTYVERYTDIKTAITPIHPIGSGDPRLRALEQYTAGIVYRANGKRDAAVDAFKDALRVWLPAKYHWRAAQAAFHLGELTARDGYLDLSKALVDMYVPRAYFAGMLDPYRGALEHPDVRSLSQANRQVLMAFTQGLSNEEIATQLGIRGQTVRNAVRTLYKKFGANSSRSFWRILRDRRIV